MDVALAVALAMTQAAMTTQPGSAPPSQATSPTAASPSAGDAAQADRCPAPSVDSTAIVICTERPQGYRLNPDIMEAKREMRSGGRPVRQGVNVRPDCATVGPFPCVNAGINLIGAALTAVQMAQRLAKGQEVGSMFETDPHPDEYHLYLMVKARREAEEAQKAAAAKAKAAAAAAPPSTKTNGN